MERTSCGQHPRGAPARGPALPRGGGRRRCWAAEYIEGALQDRLPEGLGVQHLSPQTLTTAEQKALLQATAGHARDHLIFPVALGTGLRLPEKDSNHQPGAKVLARV